MDSRLREVQINTLMVELFQRFYRIWLGLLGMTIVFSKLQNKRKILLESIFQIKMASMPLLLSNPMVF
jgi:hypothetical protein